jgi:hypothetical protein
VVVQWFEIVDTADCQKGSFHFQVQINQLAAAHVEHPTQHFGETRFVLGALHVVYFDDVHTLLQYVEFHEPVKLFLRVCDGL